MDERLDLRLSKMYGLTRAKAVLVDGKVCCKPSFLVDENCIELVSKERYVSRGAYKLLGAIEDFKLDFTDKVVLDIGASTGGFTQVALLHGALKVYAVDVGEGQLDKTLLASEKVVNIEKTDFRDITLSQVADTDLIIGDISFISLTKILPKIKSLFGNEKEVVLLFKPQYECGKQLARKGKGIIKDKKVHIFLLNEFLNFCKDLGFTVVDISPSSIKGKSGNIEYLIHFKKDNNCDNFTKNIENIVDFAFKNAK